MKKIFIALSVLAALTMGFGSALAAPGVPDLAPGTDFVGIFLVSKTAVDSGAGQTTEYLISEVKGLSTTLHLDFYTTRSKWVHNRGDKYTAWSTTLVNVAKWISEMNVTEKAALEVTLDGEDYYAGYFYADNSNNAGDNIIADMYLLDLAVGLASASGVPVKEFYNDPVHRARISGSATGVYEKWSPNALAAANNLIWGDVPVDPTWFAFYPRYLINNLTTSRTLFFIWSSRNGVQFHIYVINKEEKYRSTTITLDELTLIDAIDYIAQYLIDTDAAPYAGFFNFTIPGATRGGGLAPLPGPFATNGLLDWEVLGWNWQQDKGASGALNWSVLTQMARDVGTIGVAPQPEIIN